MKAVFAHDHVFTVWEGQVYSPGRLPYKSWVRYLEHFSTLTVVARARAAKSADDVRGLSRADGPGVSFAFQQRSYGLPWFLYTGSQESRALRELIRGADVVVARIPSRIGIEVARLARQVGCPLAVEVVGSALHSLWYHGALTAKLYAPLLDMQTRKTARHARFALYVTRQYLQERYPCDGLTASASNVAITSAEVGLLQRRKDRVLDRKGPLVIGFVGTLSARYKGLDTLLRAISRLRRGGVPCVLKVVGDGPASPWRDLAKSLGVLETVEFLGTLPGSEAVRDWMQSIDVFVLGSKTEGLPRALIEAMSCGCLCFATDVGGIPELLSKPFMFRPGDSDGLVELLRSAALKQSMLADAVFENAATAERYTADKLEDVRRKFFQEVAEHVALGVPVVVADARLASAVLQNHVHR